MGRPCPRFTRTGDENGMVRNRRRPLPALICCMFAAAVAGLAYMALFRTPDAPGGADAFPEGGLAQAAEESYYPHGSQEGLSYQFYHAAYMVDIPDGSYARMEGGVFLSESSVRYLTISEYGPDDAGSGVEHILKVFPGNLYESYAPHNSHADAMALQDGYINGLPAAYGFYVLHLQDGGSEETGYAAVYAVADKKSGVTMAVCCLTYESTYAKRKEIQAEAESIAKSLRENEGFREEESPAIRKQVPVTYGEPEGRGQEGLSGAGGEPDAGEKAGSGESLKTEENGMPGENRQAVQESGKEAAAEKPAGLEEKPAGTEEAEAQEEQPEGAPGTGQAESAASAPAMPEDSEAGNPEDVSVQSFTSPLAGYPMTVTVSIQAPCSLSECTVTKPDGTPLPCSSRTENSFVFVDPASSAGAYACRVTHFSEVQQVHIRLKCP